MHKTDDMGPKLVQQIYQSEMVTIQYDEITQRTIIPLDTEEAKASNTAGACTSCLSHLSRQNVKLSQ